MNIKLRFENENIKSIKFHKNGKVKQEVYRDGTMIEYDENGKKYIINILTSWKSGGNMMRMGI